MPRKKLLRSDIFPYHVTARTNNQERFPLPLEVVWSIVTHELLLISVLYKIEIQALVLMPNHLHLILTVPEQDLGKIMNLFMSDVTREMNRRTGRTGHAFGGPYFWSIITSTRYYGHALKYVYRNPVRGKLCDQVEEYEFSTVQGLLGLKHLSFPLHYTRAGLELNIPDPELHFEWLEWLNRPFPKEAEKLIQKCMRKKEIKELLSRRNRKHHPLLSTLI